MLRSGGVIAPIEFDLHSARSLPPTPLVGQADGAAILAGIVRTVLPMIERTGVATAAELGADTLQQCLSGELATQMSASPGDSTTSPSYMNVLGVGMSRSSAGTAQRGCRSSGKYS